LQETLERVRATEWQQFPRDLKHLDAVAGENGVSLSPPFAEFETNELSLTVRGEVYRYNADAFFQINPSLLGQLVEYAIGDASGGVVVDLYCGVGLFTLPLARQFQNVMAIEANQVAVRFARRNLQDAGLSNARVTAAGVAEWFRGAPVRDVDFVLLDPPRAGAAEQVRELAHSGVGRIAYVSCNPATFARDARTLVDGGYTLDWVKPVGQFRWSTHIELAAHLRR